MNSSLKKTGQRCNATPVAWKHNGMLIATCLLLFSMATVTEGFISQRSIDWGFIPFFASGAVIILGCSLQFLKRRKKASVYWYLVIGALLMLGAWYVFAPDYFLDFTSMREPRHYWRGGLPNYGKGGGHIARTIYLMCFQMMAFYALAIWEKWISRFHGGYMD